MGDVDAQAAAERIVVAELLLDERFAHDRDGQRVDGVAGGEITPGHLRNPQRLEEVWRDRPNIA